MPELPEVETMCRGIASIVGRCIVRVHCPPCAYRPLSIEPSVSKIQQRLRGAAVREISRLGKRVVIHIGTDALILQPKMSGLVSLEQPPSNAHVRLQIDFAGKPSLRLLYWDRRGLGTIELLPESEIAERIIRGRLGPDALTINFEEFSARLSATSRPIKVALLDQKLLAGIGNLYASEILHVAKIHPAQPSSKIGPRKKRKIFDAMQSILLTAIAYEGSTLSDGTYRNALNDPGSYQAKHLVYGRSQQTCITCQRGKIQRIVQAQRSTFYCPTCQR